MQPPPDEAKRQQQLDEMKERATALLVGAGGVFLFARLMEPTYGFWMGAVRATAEAAMVGGLADWFAVTALFRHPLGIPIPHTAIVPTRKDRVGRTLGAFVQRNFLTRNVIEARMRTLGVADRLARWMVEPENARAISRHVASALASASQMVPDAEVERVIGDSVATRVRKVKVAPLLGRLLGVLTEGDRHQVLLNEVLRVVTRAVQDNRTLIRTRIGEETPWWVPDAIDEKIYRKVLSAIERTMTEIEADPEHPLRDRFDTALHRFMENLESSPETVAKIEGWKEDLLATDTARKFSASLWTDGKAALVRYAEEPDPDRVGAVEHAITRFGDRVLEDPELLRRVDDMIIDVAAFLVDRYQTEVADLISHTVQSWDPEVTSQRVELAIGRDLQFIRINGTLVGGLAGLLIYFLSHAIG